MRLPGWSRIRSPATWSIASSTPAEPRYSARRSSGSAPNICSPSGPSRNGSPTTSSTQFGAARPRWLQPGLDLTGNNPGAENLRGGLSTIEEKSLGAIAKGGSRPIRGVLALAAAPEGPGLYVMDAPGFSPESLTGFAAAGVQAMLFTTGAGNSFCNAIAPTIKISARPDTLARLDTQIDFDASAVFAGREDVAAAAERLFERLLDVASGSLTWGEIVGEIGGSDGAQRRFAVSARARRHGRLLPHDGGVRARLVAAGHAEGQRRTAAVAAGGGRGDRGAGARTSSSSSTRRSASHAWSSASRWQSRSRSRSASSMGLARARRRPASIR